MKPLRYHESKQRGSQEFPLDYHYIDQQHPRYEMPYHWHEETEVIHVISGQFELMLDGVLCHLSEGDAAFIASGRLHGGEPKDCVYECVVFDLRMLMKAGDFAHNYLYDVNSRRIDLNPHIACTDGDTLRYLLPMFQALRANAQGYEMIAAGSLLCFLGDVKRRSAYQIQAYSRSKETRNVLRLKRVFEMIESRPDHPPSVQELASAIGMVPKYFIRFFHAATHYNPAEYIAFYRIEQACYEIASTDKNVTEIALDMGFSEASSFIHCFKRHKGVTPGEYIKMIRTEGGTHHAQRNPPDPVP